MRLWIYNSIIQTNEIKLKRKIESRKAETQKLRRICNIQIIMVKIVVHIQITRISIVGQFRWRSRVALRNWKAQTKIIIK